MTEQSAETPLLAEITATLIDHMGNDMRIVNAARGSFNKQKDEEQDLDSKDIRLLHYLTKHNHWVPFVHGMVTLRIDAPIFVARQWCKSDVGVSRMPWGMDDDPCCMPPKVLDDMETQQSEVSRRYVDTAPQFWFPKHVHARPENGIKQGSGKMFADTGKFLAHAKISLLGAKIDYLAQIAAGIAPEEARMFLPQNMMTTWTETGSIAYFVRVCALRLAGNAQKSGTQELAQKVASLLQPIFPYAWGAIMKKYEDTHD